MQASTASKQAPVDELTSDLAALVKYLMGTTGRDFFQAIEDLDLSLSQLKTLHVLVESGEPTSLKHVSDALGLSLPGVSRAVEGLVKRKLVTRTEDARDRRSKLVAITARGRATAEELYALRVAGLRDFVEGLEPGEREALAPALRQLAQRPEIAVHLGGS